MLEDKVNFTAIFDFSDMIAWELIYTLNKNGLNVPKDIAVVGFDNIQSRMFLPLPLTSVNPSKKKMARRAVDILLKKMNGSSTEQYFHDVCNVVLTFHPSCEIHAWD